MTKLKTITTRVAGEAGNRSRRFVVQGGFTLLEVCLAMAVLMLILGISVLGISGVQAEASLKKMASKAETLARDSLLQAVMEQRSVQVDLGAFAVGGRLQVKRYGDTRFRDPKRGEVWEFSRTGVCEPLEVKVTNEVGTFELGFDPLTGCARRKSILVNS